MALSDSVASWTAELKSGISADRVIAAITSALAESLVEDSYEYNPEEMHLAALLEELEDDKRNPMLALGEEFALIFNNSDADEILNAVEGLANYQEMLEDFEDDNDEEEEPVSGMFAAYALVELALERLHDLWPERLVKLASRTTSRWQNPGHRLLPGHSTGRDDAILGAEWPGVWWQSMPSSGNLQIVGG